jgi:predicted nucleotidyltransferase
LEYWNYFLIFAPLNINSQTMSTQAMTQQIAEYFKTQPVLKAWLFGSFARGEEREDSDVDVLVKFDRSIPIGLFAYVRMHRELEERLGRKVDLVEEGTLRPAAQQTANRDLKVIYERNY